MTGCCCLCSKEEKEVEKDAYDAELVNPTKYERALVNVYDEFKFFYEWPSQWQCLRTDDALLPEIARQHWNVVLCPARKNNPVHISLQVQYIYQHLRHRIGIEQFKKISDSGLQRMIAEGTTDVKVCSQSDGLFIDGRPSHEVLLEMYQPEDRTVVIQRQVFTVFWEGKGALLVAMKCMPNAYDTFLPVFERVLSSIRLIGEPYRSRSHASGSSRSTSRGTSSHRP